MVAESDSYEEARSHQKSLKRRQSSHRPKQPTESDSYGSYETDEKKTKQGHQPVVVEGE